MSYYETQEHSGFVTQQDADNSVTSARLPPPVFQNQSVVASAVHGRGMWQNFLRSFSNPLYALLDLFDNAVDASWNIPHHLEPKIKVDVDTIGNHGGQGGIYIRNAASDPIPHMSKILEVFRSTKENQNSAIGENGVGIKHACANLSNLSLVLTKTNDDYSIGVLMKDLQLDVPHFPHVTIPKTFTIYGKLKRMSDDEPLIWGKVFEVYGDGDLNEGIDRISIHFEEMNKGNDWKNATDVFTIIICKLRQTGHSENNVEDPDDLDDDHEGAQRSVKLLEQFANKLPILYIHLNNNIKVQVRNNYIDMAYWETRLADLTLFEVAVPQGPEADPKLKLTHAEPPYAHPTVRFWLGFNVYRPSSSAHIYYYSRESGRLIKELADCRSMLKLQAGSTDFKQGLTIIVDDHNSTLPLNPTKQDLSFAFQEHGDTHKTNLNFWLAGVTHFFWTYHFETVAQSKKSTLTSKVTGAKNLFDDAIASKGIVPLNEMEPIRFNNIPWSDRRVPDTDEDGNDVSYTKLFVFSAGRREAQRAVGRDTLVQLSDVTLNGRAKNPKRKAAAVAESSNKKDGKEGDDAEDQESDDAGDDAPPKKKKATARKSLQKRSMTPAELQQRAKHEQMLRQREEEIQRKEEEIKRLQEEKEQEIKEKDKQTKKLQKENSQLRKELDLAKRVNGEAARAGDKRSFNVRLVNHHTNRRSDIHVPAEAHRSIKQVLQNDKSKREKIMIFPREILEKLKRKEADIKVGIWDPSKSQGNYNYIYDIEEMKTETTLQLFNFLTQDGMESFQQKYDPVHLCIFVQNKDTAKEDEGEYSF